MSTQKYAGVYQLDNGNWGFRYAITVNGKRQERKKVRDENGNPFKNKTVAAKARTAAINELQAAAAAPEPSPTIEIKTVKEIYLEYCEKGRNDKAYTTKLRQDSLWKNHLEQRFGDLYINQISVAEIQDYLADLYYNYGFAYKYVESFLKMFYLIFGQAYSRNYLPMDYYNKICINKDSKIHMPKLKVDDDLDIVAFDGKTMDILDQYFYGTNAETAYMLGKYCGLRINECYGLKWENVDLENGIINIDRQMQYQEGVIKIVPLKTRNAKRKIYMNSKLKAFMQNLWEQRKQDEINYGQQRQQKQTYVPDLDGSKLSSLELVNSLPNGKIQTVNSMKYHSRTLQEKYRIDFKYHYLRHTYGTNLAALNTPEYLLCNQMGHANINVTHKYYIAISETGIHELLKNLEQM